MRRLTLLRHAKSSWDDETLDDFYRPLNDRGRRAAKAIGKHLAERGVKFDRILASPAQRVAETLKGLAKGGWRSGPVEFDEAIYHATASDLVTMLRRLSDDVHRVLLVGHNPAIGVLTVQLTEDDAEGLRAQATAKYPTGALAEVELDVDHWSEVGSQSGRLVAFTTPRSMEG